MSEDLSQSETAKVDVETDQTAGRDCQNQVDVGEGDKNVSSIPASRQSCSTKTTTSCTAGDTAVHGTSGYSDGDDFCFSNRATTDLEDLRQLNEQFLKDRNWHQFHSPRNVLLALVGEVGELAEIFQWKGEVSEGLPELSQAERDHVGQEMSDILIYLIYFACRCKIDLPKAVENKMAANSRKYPIDKAYGRANKYTDYQ